MYKNAQHIQNRICCARFTPIIPPNAPLKTNALNRIRNIFNEIALQMKKTVTAHKAEYNTATTIPCSQPLTPAHRAVKIEAIKIDIHALIRSIVPAKLQEGNPSFKTASDAVDISRIFINALHITPNATFLIFSIKNPPWNKFVHTYSKGDKSILF